MITSSCSLTKSLQEDEEVYMGTRIKIKDVDNGSSIEDFKFNLKGIPKTRTKNGIGNIYIGLYNIFEKAEKKGLKHWIKYKLGNPPVVYKEKLVATTEAKLKFYLKGKGFFSNTVSCESSKDHRKVKLDCDITLNQRYVIDSLIFPEDSTYYTLELNEKQKRAILKERDYYDRDKLDFERLRISKLAGEKGYAHFNSNNVHFYVDTSHMNNTVDIYSRILSPSGSTKHVRYVLDSIRIFPNYSLKSKATNLTATTISDKTTVYESQYYLKHDVLDRLILEDPHGYYNRSLELSSISRLQNLGIFKFINVVNEPSKNSPDNYLTQNIYLTPIEMQNISAEFEVNNRSGNILGTGASTKYQHNNLFHHGEKFTLSLGGSIETQFGQSVSFINSSDLSIQADIAFPRLITPFIKIKEKRNLIPRTVVSASYTVQRRTEFYSLQSLTTRFGYRFRESATKLHEIFPININEVQISQETPEFLDILSRDLRLARSFDDFLIAGLQYAFTFSDQVKKTKRDYQYFKFDFETSGNLISLVTGASKTNPQEIVGLNFAQYVKVTLDYRKYFEVKEADLATRVIMGVGNAYGNSEEIPYIKQYIIGGSNSIRAFRLRGLGPGFFFADTIGLTDIQSQFVDQTGDIKLEMNAEYRFPLFSYFKSAIFIDAGNVWLINNQERPEGNFSFNEFYKQIGIGTGFGLRLDFDFFLIRLDVAFPLRAPTPNNNGFTWRLSDIDPLSAAWRSQNLRYNLGIGYPF
ncbi:BamA/TamA family outer membrane protein [Saprospiraceae bacterium]|nr:BamA/TamA family outer membrane protein [Saprospiraceae bacterium]